MKTSRKALSLVLALCIMLAAFTGISATSALGAEDSLTVQPSIYVKSNGAYSLYQTQAPLTAKVGDILEVTVSIKTSTGKTQRASAIDIKTMFANSGSELKAYDNDGTLAYTNKYYSDGCIASVPALGTVVTIPDMFDTPDTTRSHFGYTAASYKGAGGFRNRTQLYSFTLVVNKSGATGISTFIAGVYKAGTDNDDVNITDEFDYQMEIVNRSEVQPVTSEPVPTTTEPVPTTTQPVPTTTKPVPTTTKPVPTTTKPVPTTTKPVPTTTKPVPTTTKPVPTTTKPVPTTTKPVPTTTKPVPTTTKPVVTTAPPTTAPPTTVPATTAPVPSIPEITGFASNSAGVNITWKAVNGAYGYRVFYKNKNGGWVKLGDTTQTSFIDAVVSNGVSYTYTVRCIDANGKYTSSYNPSGWTYTYKMPTLTTPRVTKTESTVNGVKLTWAKVTGATKYRVFYKNKSGGWSKLGDTSDTTITDGIVSNGTSYTYTVRCITDGGKYCSSYNSTGWTITFRQVNLSTPSVTSITSSPEGVKLSWGKINGATKYRVFHKSGSSWSYLAETADNSYTDKAVSNGMSYTYTVRCLNSSNRYCSSYNNTGWTIKYSNLLATPKISKLTCSPEGVTISWGKVTGAAKYRVFYKNKSGGWSKLGDTSGTTMLDAVVNIGTSYTYTVRCLDSNGSYASSYDSKGSTVTYTSGISNPRVTKLESTSEGVKLTWNRQTGVTSYRVFYKNKNGSWIKLGDTTSNTFTDTDVRVNGSYTYTVRAMNSAGRYCSGYNTTGWTYTYKP